MTDKSTASAAIILRDRRWGALFIVIAMMSPWAGAQVPTYLAEVGSDAFVTRGASRLLHYLPDDQYRFRATAIGLDPRASPEELERYALLQIGHALGLLGRSPFIGDAMSLSPSGVITPRDVATLRALYAVPSGTVVHD